MKLEQILIFSILSLLHVAVRVHSSIASSAAATDEITHLPGLNHSLSYKQYSGYLDGGKGQRMFYWLVESEQNASTSPLILWLQGGPGCSSIGGLLTESGPFRLGGDSKTLENVSVLEFGVLNATFTAIDSKIR